MRIDPKRRQLAPETPEEREALAKIGDADRAELVARMNRLTSKGIVETKDGEVVTVSASLTKEIFNAKGDS